MTDEATAVLRDARLSPLVRIIFVVVVGEYGLHDGAWHVVKQWALARQIGCHHSQVSRALRTLVKSGYLERSDQIGERPVFRVAQRVRAPAHNRLYEERRAI